MKHFSKYLDSMSNVHEETEVQHQIQSIENKMWRVMPGHLTVKGEEKMQ
jgi:hypothetical protein